MPHSTGIPACVLALLASTAQAQGPESLAELTQGTHIYGLAFDPQDEDRLLLATHDGLYAFELETEELAPIG